MKKLLWFGGVVIGLLAVAAIVLTFVLDSAVRKGVTTFGPQLTGTPVKLEGVSLSPWTGRGELKGFAVGNPPGWQSEHAFSFGRVKIDLDPLSVLGDTIVINEISITSPQFAYETKLVRSNIKDLLQNIEKATGGPGTSETSSGPGKKFIVRRFALQDGSITLGGGGIAAVTLPMPPLALNDLGVREGGVTADQIASAVMRSVLADIGSATAAAAGKLGAAGGAVATEALGSAAQKAGEGLKKLFGKDEKK